MLKVVHAPISRVVFASTGARRRTVATASTTTSHDDLLTALRGVDTASLCDADKSLQNNTTSNNYRGIQLVDGKIRAMNKSDAQVRMVGYAFTVQCTVKNDFLAVLRGLMECCRGADDGKNQVLVVDTLNSLRAVSGELFATQAFSKNMAGLLVDGPVRDLAQLQQIDLPVFATHACPYAGTIQSPGLTQSPIVIAGGVTVNPGDVIFGDNDGVVVGDVATMRQLVPIAQGIVTTETIVRRRIEKGSDTLETLTNSKEHISARMQQQESNLEFRL